MHTPDHIYPPQWPLRILRFFVKEKYLEEIEGDMEEVFQDNLERLSLRKANRLYTWEMLKLLRPALVKNMEGIQQLNQYDMFKNYCKVSVRGLMKNPLNSFINIFGLAIAIGICVFVYSYARWTYGTDQFHTNKNEIFLATFFADRDGTQQQYGTTPRPIGDLLKADFTHIKKMCRVEDRHGIVKHNENVFHERIRYTDPEFLQMFTFPMKEGSASSLTDVNSIILSNDAALKYFGEENPVGQDLLLNFDSGISKIFKVGGVAEAFPDAHTIEFEFLINFENFKTTEPAYNFDDWSAFVNATFIQVDEATHITEIQNGMNKYRLLQNQDARREWAISKFTFEPLATLHERAEYIRNDISWSSKSNYESVIYFVIIAVFMIALACFNYINIAIVSAAKRLKEIGLRKTIGASRKTVIVQFLSENIVITFFALIIGVILGVSIFIPWFERSFQFSMGFSLTDENLWLYLAAVLLFTGIASGIYPAFYISKFQVVGILKGSVKFGKKNPITKILLTFQLILACILITAAVMFTQNSAYLANRSWGYNQLQTLYAEVPDQSAFEQLSAVMEQYPEVISISGSKHHLGKNQTTAIIHLPDHEYEVDQLSVDANYFETMGLKLNVGRTFNKDDKSDRKSVVVNETFIKNIGLSQPLGQTFEIDSIPYEVIGVVKDFHSKSFFKPIQSTIFKVADKQDYRYLSMHVKAGSELEMYKSLQGEWSTLFPEVPFQGLHQKDVWGNYYSVIGVHSSVWRAIATMAILLAGLGLYGLMTLNVSGRIREFSIRKILGAGVKNISSNVTRQYAVLFLVALVLGAPISYNLIRILFDAAYAYHIPVDYSGVTIAVLILIFVLAITVSTQIRKVLKSNPVNGLKVE